MFDVQIPMKKWYFKLVLIPKNEVIKLCCDALEYSKCAKWFQARSIRVSASTHVHKMKTRQCSQNVDVNGSHHRCFEFIVSSSFKQPMAVERGRSHELVGSMVGAVYVHVLRTLRQESRKQWRN